MSSGEPGFEQFVHDSATSLLRSAYLLCGDRSQAEDLLQLTLLRVARRWPAARRSPDAYARRVLINLSRDGWRHDRRRVAEASWESLRPEPGESDRTDAIAGREAVIAALRELPIRQREVVVLRFYADLPVAETAAAMGVSAGAVKSYTSRALARMRELLGDPTTVEVSHDER